VRIQRNQKMSKVDMLEEDKPIAQQKFVCMSFVSPDKILKQKEMFMFQQFVQRFDLLKSMQKYAEFTAFLTQKYELDPSSITADLNEFCESEKDTLTASSVEDDYKTFLERNVDALEDQFTKDHEFQTNVRGVKVRGVYPSQEEASLRAKMLRENDPNFDVFVGPVGVWMPWDPDAYRTGNVEYLEKELNDLVHKKHENETAAKQYFDERVKEAKRKAIAENVKKAMENNNKLSQSIDAEGNLFNLNSMGDIEEKLFHGEAADAVMAYKTIDKKGI